MQQQKQKEPQYRIFQKLFTLSAIPIGFIVVVGIVSHTNLSYQKTTVDTIVNDKFRDLIWLSSISRRILTVHNELARVVRWVSLGYLSGQEGKRAIGRQSTTIAGIELVRAQGPDELPQGEREALRKELAEYREWVDQIGEIVDKDSGLADLYLGSADENVMLLVDTLARLEKRYNQQSQRYFQKSAERFTGAVFMFFLIFAVAVAVSISVAYLIGRSIVRPLTALANKASTISMQRDLTQRIELQSRDEVGVLASAFNAMIESLSEFYDELRDKNDRLEAAHNELEDLNRNLEAKVVRRTAEISRTNEKLTKEIAERAKIEIALRNAKQEAESANQAKSAFVASMSHELRTPLNGILGYAQILGRDESLNDTQQNGVRIIRESGAHLLSLINEILDLAKIEAGKLELAKADFGLPPFLEDLVGIFRMRAGEKGLDLQYRAAVDLPAAVHGDERRVRQIFLNLLGNAVKFTDTGTVTLEVSYDRSRLRARIRDEGCGIAQDQLEQIFLPFQQTGLQEHKAQGTGLGLTITKHMVEAMGGWLQAESQLQVGSCFTFELELPEVAGTVVATSTERRPIIGFEGGECRVLVVDDRPQNRALLVDLLRPLGFNVEEAADGREALSLARTMQPELVLLDLLMPTMDGFEFARRIRQLPEHRQTVLIAVSASVLDGQSQEAIVAGCNAFLSKPIQTEALFAEIAKQLGLRWRYGVPARSVTQAAQPEGPALSEATDVTPEQAAELYDLAIQGDIQGVMEYAQTMEGEPRLQPFLEHIQMLAREFREKELITFVERFTESNSSQLNENH